MYDEVVYISWLTWGNSPVYGWKKPHGDFVSERSLFCDSIKLRASGKPASELIQHPNLQHTFCYPKSTARCNTSNCRAISHKMFTTLYLVVVIAHACGIHVTQAKPEAAFRKAISQKTRDYSTEAYSSSSYSSEEHHEHKDNSLEKQILAEIGIQSVPPQISKVIIDSFF